MAKGKPHVEADPLALVFSPAQADVLKDAGLWQDHYVITEAQQARAIRGFELELKRGEKPNPKASYRINSEPFAMDFHIDEDES